MDEIETHRIRDEAALRALFPPVSPLAQGKTHRRLNRHDRAFIALSPFLVIGTQSADGSADVSPRGDPAGFVRVLDETTLAIPERPGNNRLDGMSNIVTNPAVALIFMVPGFDETLRISGRARITTAPDLLASMAVNDRAPRCAVVVDIAEIFLHCAKAFRRAALWDPANRQPRETMPSLRAMMLEEATGAPPDEATVRAADDELERRYAATMY